MNNLRPAHIEIEQDDDLEDSVLSTVTSGIASNDLGTINSIGQYEKPGEKKWNLTPLMICAALVASIANFSRGFILAYSSPSIPELKDKGLLTSVDQESWFGSLTPIGSLIGALIGGFLTHKLGRKLSILMMCVPLATGWVAIIAADQVGWLYLGRILTGIAQGMTSLVSSVYVSEIASSNARGFLGACNQVATSAGVLGAYVLTFGLDYQWMAVFGAANAALVAAIMAFMPESPRWLISKGRTAEAVVNFTLLRGCPSGVSEVVMARIEQELAKQKRNLGFKEILKPEIMKPFGVAFMAMMFQQLTGIHVLLFYTSQIFKRVGFPDAKVATAIMGTVMLLGYLFTPFLIEKTGRRRMLTFSGIGVFAGAGILGLTFFLLHNDSEADVAYFALAAAVIHMAAYSMGFGPLPWLLMGELIPLQARASVGGLATCLAWSMTFIETKSFLPLCDVIGNYGAFWIFGGSSLFAVLYANTLLPETKGKTLEEIEIYFKEGKFPDKTAVKRAQREMSAV